MLRNGVTTVIDDISVYYDLRDEIAPLCDPVAQLVQAEAGQSIRTVLVDGRVVVDGGRVLTADIARVAERMQEIAERLRGEQARTFKTARRLEPLWRGMIDGARDAPLPIERLAWSATRREAPSQRLHGPGPSR